MISIFPKKEKNSFIYRGDSINDKKLSFVSTSNLNIPLPLTRKNNQSFATTSTLHNVSPTRHSSVEPKKSSYNSHGFLVQKKSPEVLLKEFK
jgi:hypothetical protein